MPVLAPPAYTYYSERIVGTLQEFYTPPDSNRIIVKPKEIEVNVVWYGPTLDSFTLDGYIVMLYSTTRKVEKSKFEQVGGLRLIPRTPLRNIHAKYTYLIYRFMNSYCLYSLI